MIVRRIIALVALLLLILTVVDGINQGAFTKEAWQIYEAWGLKICGNYDGAFAVLDNIIKENPKYANAYDSKARFESELKKEDLAVADYTRAIQLDPKNGEFYQARAYSLAQIGRYDEAIKDCEIALKSVDDKDYADGLFRWCQQAQQAKQPKATSP